MTKADRHDRVLQGLRKVCLGFPETVETLSFGHPTFHVVKKPFCVLEEYKGELSVCAKVGKQMQGVFLQDSRFYMTPYCGKHGWVSLRVGSGRLSWKEIGELCHESYRQVAPPKLLKSSNWSPSAPVAP